MDLEDMTFQRDELRAMLKRLEWCQETDMNIADCPICGATNPVVGYGGRSSGHIPDCELARLLR